MQLKQKTLHCTKRIFTFTSYELRVLIAILYILMSVIDNFLYHFSFNSIVAVFLGVTAVLYISVFVTKKHTTFFGFALILMMFCRNWNLLYSRCRFKHLDRVLHFTSFYLIYLFIIMIKKG
jgi:hypothetical protein